MANWLRLRRQSHAPREWDGTETIYAAADGTLMHMDPDGSESELGAGGGGGSQPIRFARKTINFDDANVITGVLVATIEPGEILLPTGVKISATNYPLGASNVFMPESWDGTDPQGAFLFDNGVDDPYEFGSGIALDGFADAGAIFNDPAHPDMWAVSDLTLCDFLNQAYECRDGAVDVLFRVTSGDDGSTDPEPSQGQLKIVLGIVAAP